MGRIFAPLNQSEDENPGLCSVIGSYKICGKEDSPLMVGPGWASEWESLMLIFISLTKDTKQREKLSLA